MFGISLLKKTLEQFFGVIFGMQNTKVFETASIVPRFLPRLLLSSLSTTIKILFALPIHNCDWTILSGRRRTAIFSLHNKQVLLTMSYILFTGSLQTFRRGLLTFEMNFL